MKNLPRILTLLALVLLIAPVHVATAEAKDVPGGKEFLEGRRLQGAGDWAGSIERFRAAADVYSLFADYALYQTAQSALQLGDTDLLASALEDLLGMHPDTSVAPRARMELINLYVNTGEKAKAAPYLETALRGATSTRESASLTLMLADAYAAAGKASISEGILWRVIHNWPSRAEALEAVEKISAPDTPQKSLAIAKVYALNKKARKALDILEELMIDPRVAPLMPEILSYMAQSFATEGKKQAAVDLYTEIIADYPKSSFAGTAFFERANHRRRAGLTSEALDDYAQVVERFPKSYMAPQALRERAKIFEKLGAPDEYDEYGRLLKGYPKYALAYTSTMYWGVKLYQSGEYTEARRVFEKLAAADLGYDANADAAFWIAKCTMAQGNTNLAKIQLAGVIKRFDESHQSFRARSVLATLAEARSFYSQDSLSDWERFFAFARRPFAGYENASAEAAYPLLENELAHLDRQALDRLEFLMLNGLPEAKWELDNISRSVSGSNARYALGWALFQTRAYNDSIKAASSLRGRFKEEPRSTRLWYLLYPAAYPELVHASTSRYGVDPMLSLAVMREESHFAEGSLSAADACGLMQIIPRTGEWLAGKVFGPASFDRSLLFRPEVNIELGSYYLDYLLDKFDNNVVLALAAYNWGEGNLRRWLDNSPPGDLDVFIESIPADETRRYVKKVLRSYAVYHSLYPADHLASPAD